MCAYVRACVAMFAYIYVYMSSVHAYRLCIVGLESMCTYVHLQCMYVCTNECVYVHVFSVNTTHEQYVYTYLWFAHDTDLVVLGPVVENVGPVRLVNQVFLVPTS